MNTVKATFFNGQIVLGSVPDWPDGTNVLIEPYPREEPLGIREEDWPTDPEGVARHLALMDQIEPLEMTPGEEAEWQAARKAQKDFELAKWEEKWGKIESQFE